MTWFDRLLQRAAEMHAARTRTAPQPAPPPRMPFTVPAREDDKSTCVTCAIVWDSLDVLGRNMPDDTNLQHFVGAVGSWWLATAVAAYGGSIPEVMHLLFRLLHEHGVAVEVSVIPMAPPGATPGPRGPQMH